MVSKSETVLQALFAALQAHAPAGAKVLRNETQLNNIPPAGIMILRDGSPGEPEELMSPPSYWYDHRAEIEVVTDTTVEARNAAFDRLKLSIAAALAADRTLGGTCDHAIGEAPVPADLPIEGAEGFKAAIVPVVLSYGTPDPLT